MSIDIKFTINDILLNQESLQKKNKYTCPICLELIYKKSVYQCKSGHIACEQCWIISLETGKACVICKIGVNSFKDLSRCLVIEQLFGQEECCCIYSFTDEIFDIKGEGENFKKSLIKDKENGCKENMVVDEIDTHLQICKFKFSKCPNKGCNVIIRFNSLEQHEDQCGFKLIKCEYCKEDILKNHLNHIEECPKVTIECSQGCSTKIKRDEMKIHVDNDCGNTTIHCIYEEQGCLIQMKRSELHYHLENVNHQKFMSQLIGQLSSKVRKYEMILNSVKENLDDQYIKKKQLRTFSDLYKNKWIISNYSNIATMAVYINSPSFFVITHEFHVSLIPNYKNDDNDQNHLELYLKSKPQEKITVNYSLTLINVLDKNKSISIKNEKRVFEVNENIVEKVLFIPSDLVNKDNGWLDDDDKLTIEIYIKLLDDIEPLKNFKNFKKKYINE
ncbi:hypothetical protein ACTFIV_007999 [Dictyostelium citrinum]